MNPKEAAREALLRDIAGCRGCRFCVDVCPTYQASDGVESMSAFGRLQIMGYLLRGILQFDDALTYMLYSCLQCRRCEEVCKSKGQNLEICRMIQTGRQILSGDLMKGTRHEGN